jgi:hypothetical protein
MKEALKTEAFRSSFSCHFLTPLEKSFSCPWRKLYLRNSLYNKELAIFSEEPLETPAGFPGALERELQNEKKAV